MNSQRTKNDVADTATISSDKALVDFVLAEWDREIPEAVTAAADDITARYGDAVLGVLFYGSCLRTGEIEDKILDFYVVVEDYHLAYQNRWLALANQILPPNVFYHEIDVDGMTVRSKYAVVSAADLRFRASAACMNVSIWARFCQPCMLVRPRSDAAKAEISIDVAAAICTMLSNLLELKPWATSSRDLWVAAFEETYAAELRSERGGKGLEIYLLDQSRYDELTPIALNVLGIPEQARDSSPPATQPSRTDNFQAKFSWAMRRTNGKLVSFLRLVKASMTFDGGIDYLAWKIRRHSGVDVEIKDWMRKHPIIAGVVLFWNLRKKGAFR